MNAFTFRGSNSVIFIVASQIKWGHLIKERAGLPRSGKNVRKMKFFQVREKSGNFVDGQGNLERTLKVREKSGNLKIDSYGSMQKIIYSVQKGKRCTFS